MNPKATALLFALVAAVAGFVFFYEIRGEDERAAREEADKRLFPGFEADEVEWIELATEGGDTARVERREGGWALTAPFDFPADEAAASGLTTALVGLVHEAAFDDPAALAEYGLEGEPLARFAAGGAEHALRIGDRTPIGGNTYAATGDDAPVYAVAAYRTTAFQKSLDDLREKRILRFERDRVRALDVRWQEGSVRVERDVEDGTPGAWRVAAPLEDAADGQAVDRLLSDLEFLRATAFRPRGQAAEGLDEPAFVAEIELAASEAGGEPETLRIAIGSVVVEDRRDAEGPLDGAGYQVASARLDELPRTVDAYRDRTLASFVGSDAERIELTFHAEGESQSHVVTVTRGEGGWTSEPEVLDPAKLTTLLSELAALDGASVAAESAGPAELAGLGLEPPRVGIRVLGAAGEDDAAPPTVLAEVALGLADPERGIAARRPDRAPVYWLSYDAAEFVPVSLDALRNRFLAPEPEEAEAPEAEPQGQVIPE